MIEDIFVDDVVIEGEEPKRDSDRGSDDDDKKKDEEKEKEKPKIRKKIGPRPVLNAARLTGPRGIATMEKFFSDIKLTGKRGMEEKELDIVLKRLELWTHRLYPRGQFDDCLKKIEKLGTNKTVRNQIKRIRLGLEDGSGESDIVRDEPTSPPSAPIEDPFDGLVSSSTSLPTPKATEMTKEQRDRMLKNRLIAEEKRVARMKKALESGQSQ